MRAVPVLVAAALQLRTGDEFLVKPNEFTEVGCMAVSGVTDKVEYKGPRDVTPDTCFSFCQGVAGKEDPVTKAIYRTRYFAVEGGSKPKCWCATVYSGTNTTGCEPCARTLGGATYVEESGCGGPSAASMYLMHHCTVTAEDVEAVKNETVLKEVVREQENRKNFREARTGRACSKAHSVKAGPEKAETLVGSVDECKQACGEEVMCAMFTYDEGMQRCLFSDAMDNSAERDGKFTCWAKNFGKGPVNIKELLSPAPDVPAERAEAMSEAAQPFVERVPEGATGTSGGVIDASR
jgi:hypothetical protein